MIVCNAHAKVGYRQAIHSEKARSPQGGRAFLLAIVTLSLLVTVAGKRRRAGRLPPAQSAREPAMAVRDAACEGAARGRADTARDRAAGERALHPVSRHAS